MSFVVVLTRVFNILPPTPTLLIISIFPSWKIVAVWLPLFLLHYNNYSLYIIVIMVTVSITLTYTFILFSFISCTGKFSVSCFWLKKCDIFKQSKNNLYKGPYQNPCTFKLNFNNLNYIFVRKSFYVIIGYLYFFSGEEILFPFKSWVICLLNIEL